ncbi:hypothetical protein N015_18725 [Pseudomonas asturiensis]|uniref:Uncharacterized protein n=1 Tax=Pseudomonas asturiensis TaxID=1190415 RepID=A0ABX6HFJ6_9PSED|nr:hypothetical protein [Pseudomonas asturiensis]QHF04331.1 hypothetical protein N015_18725 [Pseudomonas asturiensis]
MHKRPDDDNTSMSDFEFFEEMRKQREREVDEKLDEAIAKKRAEALEDGGQAKRVRGHATRVLKPRIPKLRLLLQESYNLGEITETLREGGIEVNYHSLRNFIMKHMPEEYREFVAIGKNKGDPEFGREMLPDVVAANTPPEFMEPKTAPAALTTATPVDSELAKDKYLAAATPRKINVIKGNRDGKK